MQFPNQFSADSFAAALPILTRCHMLHTESMLLARDGECRAYIRTK